MEKIKLNQDAGSMPLYSQIKQIILNDIKNGVYRLNETIPTEKQLQEIFGVSRMTIRLGYRCIGCRGVCCEGTLGNNKSDLSKNYGESE